MARKPNPERLQALYEAVETHPGKRPGFFARHLKIERSAITRALPALEESGYLLSEDKKGGLWPFRRAK